MTSSNIEAGYYTKDGARAYTGLASRTLEYAVSQGRLRAFKVGKRVLFAREDLDRFIRQQTAGVDLDAIVNDVVRDLGERT